MELSEIEEILKPYLEENNLKLYEIIWVREFGYQVLRVSLDKVGGIDIESLAKANEFLSEKLDAYESELPEYMLEVCSPGAEKTLRNKEEILESINNYVNIKTLEETIEGKLISFIDDVLIVEVNNKGRFKKIEVMYDTIKKIRLAVKL